MGKFVGGRGLGACATGLAHDRASARKLYIWSRGPFSHAFAASWGPIVVFAVIAALAAAVWAQLGETLAAKVQLVAITLALTVWVLLLLHNCTTA